MTALVKATRLRDTAGASDAPYRIPGGLGVDSTAALQSLLNDSAANGREAFLKPGATYRFSALTLPDNLVLRTRGATLRSDGTVVGNAVLVTVGANCNIDQLKVTVPVGGSGRVVQFDGAGAVCDAVRVVADVQTGDIENLDGAVQIRASNVRIGLVDVEKYEVGLVVFGNITPIDNVCIDRLLVRSYVRGAYIRNATHVTIGFAETVTASANATTNPGHNGVLTSGVEDFTLEGYSIANSGEHGIRIGGSNGAELRTKRVAIGDGTVRSPGQCGLKCNPGTNLEADRHKWITLGNVTTIDCAATSATGPNEDAVRIENCDHVTVGKVTALKDAKANSCEDGLYIAQSADVTVLDYYIDTPAANGVRISELSEAVSGAVGAHTIYGGLVKDAGGNTITVECPTVAIANIVIDGFTSLRPVSDAVGVTCLSAANVLIRGDSFAPGSTKHYDGASSEGICVDIAAKGRYRGIGPAELAAQSPHPGMHWLRDAPFDPAVVTGDVRGTVVLTSTAAPGVGTFGPAIVGTKNQSTRRRVAMVPYASGTDDDQYGWRFYVYGSAVSGSDVLTLAMEINHAGVVSMPLAPTFADEAAAVAGGLTAGQVYKTATGALRIKL